MVRGGSIFVGLMLLGGCVFQTFEDAGLPTVPPEGPAAEAMTYYRFAEPARIWLGWMLAFETNGHFKDYSDAQKIVATRLRVNGSVCEDDRDTRYRITYPSGLTGMPVHMRMKPCVEGYKGYPRPEEFGGAGKPAVVAAARRLGMTCSNLDEELSCALEKNVPTDFGKKITRRVALLSFDGSVPTLTLAGFEDGQ
jgi:hypothetical protein